MNELITRHLMAETTQAEEWALLEWRQASPHNEAAYRRRARLWTLLGNGAAPADRTAPSADALIARAGVRVFPIRDARHAPVAAPPRSPRRARLALIGGLLAAGIAAVLIGIRTPGAPAVEEFVADPHGARTVHLHDGTMVRLAPRSRLRFDNRSARERRVAFEGVGYFAVARDEARPFTIRTVGGEAHVLGTRFELRTDGDAMRVVVVEGRVALEAVGKRREVTANQMGRSGKRQAPTVVDVANAHDYLDWMGSVLVFDATPLARVARELSHHYQVRIDILDRELGQREVTAWLPEQSFSAALTAVCSAVNAICTIHRDRVTMEVARDIRGGRSARPARGASRLLESARSDVQ